MINKLLIKNLKYKNKKNIIIKLFLIFILFFGILILSNAGINLYKINNFSDYNVRILDIEKSKVEKIKKYNSVSYEINKYMIEYEIGIDISNNNKLYALEDIKALFNVVDILDGRLPKKSDEIILSENEIKTLDNPMVEDFVLLDGSDKQYKVVGIYKKSKNLNNSYTIFDGKEVHSNTVNVLIQIKKQDNFLYNQSNFEDLLVYLNDEKKCVNNDNTMEDILNYNECILKLNKRISILNDSVKTDELTFDKYESISIIISIQIILLVIVLYIFLLFNEYKNKTNYELFLLNNIVYKDLRKISFFEGVFLSIIAIFLAFILYVSLFLCINYISSDILIDNIFNINLDVSIISSIIYFLIFNLFNIYVCKKIYYSLIEKSKNDLVIKSNDNKKDLMKKINNYTSVYENKINMYYMLVLGFLLTIIIISLVLITDEVKNVFYSSEETNFKIVTNNTNVNKIEKILQSNKKINYYEVYREFKNNAYITYDFGNGISENRKITLIYKYSSRFDYVRKNVLEINEIAKDFGYKDMFEKLLANDDLKINFETNISTEFFEINDISYITSKSNLIQEDSVSLALKHNLVEEFLNKEGIEITNYRIIINTNNYNSIKKIQKELKNIKYWILENDYNWLTKHESNTFKNLYIIILIVSFLSSELAILILTTNLIRNNQNIIINLKKIGLVKKEFERVFYNKCIPKYNYAVLFSLFLLALAQYLNIIYLYTLKDLIYLIYYLIIIYIFNLAVNIFIIKKEANKVVYESHKGGNYGTDNN